MIVIQTTKNGLNNRKLLFLALILNVLTLKVKPEKILNRISSL